MQKLFQKLLVSYFTFFSFLVFLVFRMGVLHREPFSIHTSPVSGAGELHEARGHHSERAALEQGRLKWSWRQENKSLSMHPYSLSGTYFYNLFLPFPCSLASLHLLHIPPHSLITAPFFPPEKFSSITWLLSMFKLPF